MDIDPLEPPSSTPKKPKFTPKPPRHKKTGPILPNSDNADDDDAKPLREYFLRQFNDRHRTRGSKVEKKRAGSSSTELSSQTQPKDGSIKKSSNSRDSVHEMLGSSTKTKKKYKEPWDLHSNYPISLPWRPPGSGDPEILNEQEFGEEEEYDETKINSAKELGLLENDKKRKLIAFKFPPMLPFHKPTRRAQPSTDLKDLPNGYMGKMLVYKSGAIKLKLGETIFDVSPGIHGQSAQEVAMMNTASKECCVLGQVDKDAVVSVDVSSIDFGRL